MAAVEAEADWAWLVEAAGCCWAKRLAGGIEVGLVEAGEDEEEDDDMLSVEGFVSPTARWRRSRSRRERRRGWQRNYARQQPERATIAKVTACDGPGLLSANRDLLLGFPRWRQAAGQRPLSCLSVASLAARYGWSAATRAGYLVRLAGI